MVPVEDTALAVTDTRGPGRPVVYLNGSCSTQKNWRPVTAELGRGRRHITYDERARGRSKKSADYSFEACIRDTDAVLDATGVKRPVLVGWSYGAALALHWATRNPDRLAGVVMVDGGYPWDCLATVEGGRRAGKEEIRQLFRKFAWTMPVTRRLGLAARMTADQHAEINVELNDSRRWRPGLRPGDLPDAVRRGLGRLPGRHRRGPHRDARHTGCGTRPQPACEGQRNGRRLPVTHRARPGRPPMSP